MRFNFYAQVPSGEPATYTRGSESTVIVIAHPKPGGAHKSPLEKGKGRRPWGLSWQIREPEVRHPPRSFSETAVPLW